MASIYKRSYWTTTKAGDRVRREQTHYTIDIVVDGKKRHFRGKRDRKATEQMAARLERDIARGEVGLIDPYREYRGLPVAAHLSDYLSSLRGSGRSEKYRYVMNLRVGTLIRECGWKVMADVEPAGFMRWREAQRGVRRPGWERATVGASPRTLNHYLACATAFLNWMVKNHRTAANPLAHVDRVAGESVRKRRAMSDEEVGRLLAAVPANRALPYRLGFAVGLRRSEMEKLRWGDVRLNAIPAYVQLRAEDTKARRADRVLLPETLAAALRDTKPADAAESARVFRAVPGIHQWRADLKAAGIPYKDAMGRVVDFHAGCRKTLCTRLHKAGVPLAQAMRVMRHTDARLTMVDYLDDVVLGAAVLPEALPPSPAKPAEAAAG